MPAAKITVIGGSSISSPTFVAALADLENAADLEVVLHGRSADKLDLVGRVSEQVGRGYGLAVRWTTSLDDALEGSDVVVNQIRVGGMSGREFDEQFPRRIGLIGEETLGAGGFSSAVRTIPAVRSLCEAITDRSPRARILNLTNPAGMVLSAIARLSDLTAVSVCDIPVAMTRAAAAAAGLDPAVVEVNYLGVNHLGWLTDIRTPGSASLAASVFPALRASAQTLPADWVEDLGVIPGPYLRYIYRPEANIGTPDGPTRATELLAVESGVLEQFAALADSGDVGKLAAAASARGAHWYEEIVVPAVAALAGSEARPLILQSPNAGLLPWLPDDAIVETPSLLGPGGVTARRPSDLPADCRALLAENAAYETLAVEAIITGSRRAARRALVANRLVGTIEKADTVLEACWARDQAAHLDRREVQIPFDNLALQFDELADELIEATTRVLRSGKYILTQGSEVSSFEAEFAEYCGTPHAAGVSSGTAALHLGLLAAGVGAGDEVIVPANTYAATAFAISYCGATPVMVDVDPATYNIDPGAAAAAITERTRAILPVHLYGHPAPMNEINALAKRHDLVVIEDAAQAHGATYHDRPVGSLGQLAAFSFYPTKNLGAMGDAGALVTSSDEINQGVRRLRYMGQDVKYTHKVVGFQERMDEVQGAILRIKLRQLGRWNDDRRQQAAHYNELLKALPVQVPVEQPACTHVYYVYNVKVERRDALREWLSERGISTSIFYPVPLHLQDAYADLGYAKGQFPVSEQASEETLALPVFPGYSPSMIEYVAEAVRSFYSH